MFKIQPSTTAGTDLTVETTRFPKVPECSRCDAHLAETFEVGTPHKGRILPVNAVAVIVRRTSRTNRKIARTVATLCAGCAAHEGYVA